jgi:NAD(P)-dependent dehydrogenase (short-subunit alcohol dehydrogenase family)
LSSKHYTDGGARVTFLLRNPSNFDQDQAIQKYVKSGSALLVKGDALNEEDVRRGWEAASSQQAVDFLIFTVGKL